MICNKFEIWDRVRITELEWKGIVTAIFISKKGIEYQVRYFANSKAEMEYFLESELELKQ